MVLLDLWSNFKVFHRRRRILKKNFSRYEDGYKYIVVELHKKRAIKAFRTLKEATTYLNDIGEYYRAKNYNVFMQSYSRSLSISSVAQYILFVVKYYNIITDKHYKKLMFIIHQFLLFLYF